LRFIAKRGDRYGEIMQIAFYTQNDHLFREIDKAFEEDGNYRCIRFTSELPLIRFLERHDAALVLFDSGRSVAAGRGVLSWRACHFRRDLPVMMIGQSWDTDSIIEALDAGVDEIAVGTPSAKEVLARARRTIAKNGGGTNSDSRISLGEYTIDRSTSAISINGQHIKLTARELTLAWLLFANAGTLLTREQIARAVWGKEAIIASRSIEQHIYKLRSKLSLGEHSNLQLKTVYSIGYVFDLVRTRPATVASARIGEAVVAHPF
jgi:DNA-binding response OmpR family regulator